MFTIKIAIVPFCGKSSSKTGPWASSTLLHFFVKPNQKPWAPSTTASAATCGSLPHVPAWWSCSPHHGQRRVGSVLFSPWKKSPYFCHNGGVVRHCLCRRPWSSGACSSAMRLFATSWAMPGMLGFDYLSWQRHWSFGRWFMVVVMAVAWWWW